jgi:hypothetical protein
MCRVRPDPSGSARLCTPPRGYNPGVNYRLSKHANAEMLRRQISAEWNEATLASPDQVVEGYGNRKIVRRTGHSPRPEPFALPSRGPLFICQR